MKVPGDLIYPLPTFAEAFITAERHGRAYANQTAVAFVGLARNCADQLAANLARLEQLAPLFAGWQLHIETNDNTDDTDQVLSSFCAVHRRATFTSQRLGRGQYSNEFAGRRTRAMSEYRTACQQWVRENAADVDLVCVIDFDAWGGWSLSGAMAGLWEMASTVDAYGMASVSLLQHQAYVATNDAVELSPIWMHYDAWALRLNTAWDDYTAGQGAWKQHWLPPVGSPPVPVVSAFGGMAWYEADAFLKGSYDGTDCEHVTFHTSITQRTGRRMYLSPSMRTVMRWLPEADDGGDSLDGV